MKILYLITQSEMGGAQSYVFDLADNLSQRHDVIVAFGQQGREGALARRLKATGAIYYVLPHLVRQVSPWQDILALISIVKLIRRLQPDLVHLNSSKVSILGSLAALICKLFQDTKDIRFIYTVHGWVFNEPLANWKKTFYRLAEKFTAGAKEKLICVSDYDRQTAIKNHIAPLEKLITIHNGRESVAFLPRVQARHKLQEFFPAEHLSVDETIIGTIANFYKTKGYEFFLGAVSRLITEGSKLRVVAIGDGPERAQIEKLIKAYRLENIFLLTGRLEAPQLLPAFDAYVCASVKEGLSYTLIEAMQAGLPIVATKVGGNPELIEQGQSGVLVDSRDPEALATAISALLQEPTLGRVLGEKARTKAHQDFSLEKMIRLTEKVYLAK